MKAAHRRMLTELLSLPTSPLNEHFVIDWIRRWAADRPGITVRSDVFGNLRLHLRRGRRRDARPLVLSAHMDHPGFEAVEMVSSGRSRRTVGSARRGGDGLLRAVWRGGVQPEYFPGAGVRFFTDGRRVRGRIRSVEVGGEAGRRRVSSVTVEVPRPVAPGSIGMWDLPDPTIRGSRIHARGCDDIAGLAAILIAMDELHRGRAAVDVHALCTRTEEVGFAGAIVAARNGFMPRRARVIVVECSSELPGVRMGDGPILRVGDRSAIFTPGLTAFVRQVGEDLAKQDRRFRFQRKLMDGGTCEAAAFCELGIESTGLCVALGNYHNMNRRRKRIGAEYVDLNDLDMLVKWFVALARTRRRAQPGDPALRRFIDRIDRHYTQQLKRTAARA